MRYINILTFVILVITESILGYRTAVADFKIDNQVLAILFCLGFSLLSVPLKIIYERFIEEPYEKGGFNKIPFYLFSALWLFIAYKAFMGIVEIRKFNLQISQLSEIKVISNQDQQDIRPANELEYKLLRFKALQKSKIDSTNQVVINNQNTNLFAQKIETIKKADLSGLYWFNLLLILSATIILSTGLKPINQKVLQDRANIVENLEKVYPNFINSESIKEEVPQQAQQQDEMQYTCNCCKKGFRNKHAYNGHFVGTKNKDCIKGLFTKNF